MVKVKLFFCFLISCVFSAIAMEPPVITPEYMWTPRQGWIRNYANKEVPKSGLSPVIHQHLRAKKLEKQRMRQEREAMTQEDHDVPWFGRQPFDDNDDEQPRRIFYLCKFYRPFDYLNDQSKQPYVLASEAARLQQEKKEIQKRVERLYELAAEAALGYDLYLPDVF